MLVDKYELWNALLMSKCRTENIDKLMKYLEQNMPKAGGVQVELEEVE